MAAGGTYLILSLHSHSYPLLTMAHQLQTQRLVHYRTVQIIKSACLGIGSYGAVHKAICDELPCAAKIIHPTLCETNDPGSRKIVERFDQECEFLSGVRHPHIVQYLGVSRDPESGLPVLLMELLDDNLTHFLEQSQEPLPYHIQVSLCYDIALALAYLHSNGIIHRDLSSNNVLLIAGSRAKVTDFGMSKFTDANPRMTPLTMCPGTMVYMSPEALKEPPVYTDKLDCFSHGVLSVQIMIRQFPNPGTRTQTVPFPQSPTGRIEMPVLDIVRRKSHIDLIDPTHPLLPIATECLSYSEEDRPSAQQLCHRLAALKQAPQYGESVQQAQERRTPAQDTDREERERRIRELQQQQQEEQALEIRNFRQQIEAAENRLQSKDQDFQQLHQRHARIVREYQQLQQHQVEEHQQLQRQTEIVEETQHKLALSRHELALKDRTIEEREKQLRELSQQLEVSEQLTAEFQQNLLQRDKVVRDLQESLTTKDRRIQQLEQEASGRVASGASTQPTEKEDGRKCGEGDQPTGGVKSIHLRWRKSGRAPERMERGAAVVDGRVAYFKGDWSSTVHAYDSPTQQWSTLPECPQVQFSLAVVNGLLTAIGGRVSAAGQVTNTLLSLTGEDRGRKWSKEFPPMPTKCLSTAAVCSAESLIVAGGTTGAGKDNLATVEVMDTKTCQWLTASSLPHPFNWASATICGDRLYMLGGNDTNDKTKLVLTCSLPDLLHSCQPSSLGGRLKRALTRADQHQVWQKVANMPVYWSTCTTINGQLLAVGGRDSSYNSDTDAVYRYDPTSNSWEVISHMPTARRWCLVAVLPSSELMVVGGGTGGVDRTDAVEIASVV